MKKNTLEHLSEKTGLSKSTISRVLNGKGKEFRINTETQQQVISIAKKMNYKVKAVDELLHKKNTYTIGLAVPYLSNSFFASLASTITIEAKKYDITVMLYDTQEDAELEKKVVKTMLQNNVDGILIVPCGESPKYLERAAKKTHIILIDRYFENSTLPYVTTNNFNGAYDAMQLLLESGHRNILCIQGPKISITSKERIRGCKKAVEDFGNDVQLRICGNNFSIQNGYTEMNLALNMNNRPTAVFALSNTILLGVLQAIHEQSLKIPEDISLISYDDNLYLDYLIPPITRIAQPITSIGIAAVKLFMKCVNENKTIQSNLMMSATIIKRNSIMRV
ncbi:MAG: LacI family DNA-binding transcriptional regulator [Prevotellaceae bacterium]|nr:LacI family DNA-binding transcriptional regulator [Candidatus Faecinaster equi]